MKRSRTQKPPAKPAPPSRDTAKGERIAKVIARAGLGSRRTIEELIAQGRVQLNGEALTSPARNVGPHDDIRVDGQALPGAERTRLWLYHKPIGLVTTERDPQRRPTVFDHLPAGLPRVLSVGRLDINTQGLLLLTNDGGLKRVLESPATAWLRRYRVRAFGSVTPAQITALAQGVTIDGIHYGPVEGHIERTQGKNIWLTLAIREGKNREIKVIAEHLGLQVNRLIRTSFGPFRLGELDEGAVQEIPPRILREQLGTRVMQEASVDFDSAIRTAALPAVPRPERTEAEHGPARAPSTATGKAERFARWQDSGVKPATPGRVQRDERSARLHFKPATVEDREGRAVPVIHKKGQRGEAAGLKPTAFKTGAMHKKKRSIKDRPAFKGRAAPQEKTFPAFSKRPFARGTAGKHENEETGFRKRDAAPGVFSKKPFQKREGERTSYRADRAEPRKDREGWRDKKSEKPRFSDKSSSATRKPYGSKFKSADSPRGEKSERPFEKRSYVKKSFQPRDGKEASYRSDAASSRPFRERSADGRHEKPRFTGKPSGAPRKPYGSKFKSADSPRGEKSGRSFEKRGSSKISFGEAKKPFKGRPKAGGRPFRPRGPERDR